MSDMTGDPTWDGGWEDAVERGDSLERWMLERELSDEEGNTPRGGSADLQRHEIRELSQPDGD